MKQQKFCAAFGISICTLRHWEQGLRSPNGPARVLLKAEEQARKGKGAVGLYLLCYLIDGL